MSEEAQTTLRTLIVDDEPLAIERMQVLCAEIESLQVVGTASDGESAMRLADKLAPDLLLLDMTMPGMDGLAVAREAAARDEPPAVIFVTAHEDFAVEAFDLDAPCRAPDAVRAHRTLPAALAAIGDWHAEKRIPACCNRIARRGLLPIQFDG